MKLKVKLISLFSITLFFIHAQSIVKPEPEQGNPQKTVFTHLYFLQEDSYEPEKAAQTIYAPNKTLEEKVQIAEKIKQVLDGKGIYIDINLITEDPNYIDTTHNKNLYFLSYYEKRIYLEKYDEKWYYSASTVANIDEIFKEVYPWGTDIIRNILPDNIGEQKAFALRNWQWLGVAIVIAMAFLGFWFLKKITAYIVNLFFKVEAFAKSTSKNLVAKIAKSFSLFLTFWWLSKFIPSLLLPPLLSFYVVKATVIFTIFFAAILIIRIISFGMFFAKRAAEKTDTKLDVQLVPIVDKLLKFLVALIAFGFILRAFEVDLVAIFAGLSVGALALALAAQDTVKNFIGSITIFLDHPFEIGDFIAVGGVTGTVEEVGIRATRIRTLDQSLAYVPNGEIVNSNIDNFGLRKYRRWQMQIGLLYSTPPEKMEIFIREVKNILDDYPYTVSENNVVRLNELAASSINIYVNVFMNVKSWGEDLRCRHELLFMIIRKAKEVGVDFAFPTQSIHIESMPEKK